MKKILLSLFILHSFHSMALHANCSKEKAEAIVVKAIQDYAYDPRANDVTLGHKFINTVESAGKVYVTATFQMFSKTTSSPLESYLTLLTATLNQDCVITNNHFQYLRSF